MAGQEPAIQPGAAIFLGGRVKPGHGELRDADIYFARSSKRW
jgi:hypothetical protein